jgi:hypothetical protein
MVLRALEKLRERRKAPRSAHPALKVRIDGRRYQVADWSLGGLRLADFDRPVAARDRLEGTLLLPRRGRGAFVAEVVWTDGSRVGLRFLEIAPKMIAALSELPDPGLPKDRRGV